MIPKSWNSDMTCGEFIFQSLGGEDWANHISQITAHRQVVCVKSFLLAFKIHFPFAFTSHFSSQSSTVNWSNVLDTYPCIYMYFCEYMLVFCCVLLNGPKRHCAVVFIFLLIPPTAFTVSGLSLLLCIRLVLFLTAIYCSVNDLFSQW